MAYTPGVVEGLFIDPAYHRRGLGTQLLAHAQQHAKGPLRPFPLIHMLRPAAPTEEATHF